MSLNDAITNFFQNIKDFVSPPDPTTERFLIKKLQVALTKAGEAVEIDGVLGDETVDAVNNLLGTKFTQSYVKANLSTITQQVESKAKSMQPYSPTKEKGSADAEDETSYTDKASDDGGGGGKSGFNWLLWGTVGALVVGSGVYIATRKNGGSVDGINLIIKGHPKMAKREAARRGIPVRNCKKKFRDTQCEASDKSFARVTNWLNARSTQKVGRGYVPGTLLFFRVTGLRER